jgi:hypothetical protein
MANNNNPPRSNKDGKLIKEYDSVKDHKCNIQKILLNNYIVPKIQISQPEDCKKQLTTENINLKTQLSKKDQEISEKDQEISKLRSHISTYETIILAQQEQIKLLESIEYSKKLL